jgi:hypothetical protein
MPPASVAARAFARGRQSGAHKRASYGGCAATVIGSRIRIRHRKGVAPSRHGPIALADSAVESTSKLEDSLPNQTDVRVRSMFMASLKHVPQAVV